MFAIPFRKEKKKEKNNGTYILTWICIMYRERVLNFPQLTKITELVYFSRFHVLEMENVEDNSALKGWLEETSFRVLDYAIVCPL